MIKILTETNELNLIWEYAEFIIIKDPKRGLKIFTSRSLEEFNPEEVLNFLNNINNINENIKKDITQNYYEFLIVEKNKSIYQKPLALILIDKILNFKNDIFFDNNNKYIKAGKNYKILKY
jgi:hypothetical protein